MRFRSQIAMNVRRISCVFVITSWITFSLYYYDTIYGAIKPTIEILISANKDLTFEEILTYNGTEDDLIKTPGCYIPNYGITLKFREAKIIKHFCGTRAVFIEKISEEYLLINIDDTINEYSKGNDYNCCYQFVTPALVEGITDHRKIRYSPCAPFENQTKIELLEEIIVVKCTTKLKVVYEDAYIFVKKLKREEYDDLNHEKPWNVLILGMDTMSRARLISSMPKTAQLLRNHHWLDFRAYQKVGYNTFPNVMALLTGRNQSQVHTECHKSLDQCNDIMLWSYFKKAGYYTASGEDFLRLPDTFTRYDGFKNAPTDHYMRPFFLTGENSIGNLVCTKKRPSAHHLLDYALDFTNTYKNDKFFGMFWFNSFSHNLNNVPELIDSDLAKFFETIHTNGILNKTFILFLSDHGLRYGEMRVPYESYYEERLPMLYLWVPNNLRRRYEMFKNLLVNQSRLVTPYDMYVTLLNILEIGNNTEKTSNACPNCVSIINELSRNRTCSDAHVHEKWCSCHPLTKATNDAAIKNALDAAIDDIYDIVKNIKTKNCMQCADLKLKDVLRAHSYKASNATIFVLAFQMTPGDVSYEASVEHRGDNFTVLDTTQTISVYNTRGNCVLNPVHRAYCICVKRC
ncbi:unnamed protein product [Pieris brassicae]|uniref:Uncharacterized protein n=1 Tax=Pieris brassicae TaxID=7116 RepID=A0A9P0TH59_PIEBR|nr:unnamed protein product [Pieris brassicae]